MNAPRPYRRDRQATLGRIHTRTAQTPRSSRCVQTMRRHSRSLTACLRSSTRLRQQRGRNRRPVHRTARVCRRHAHWCQQVQRLRLSLSPRTRSGRSRSPRLAHKPGTPCTTDNEISEKAIGAIETFGVFDRFKGAQCTARLYVKWLMRLHVAPTQQ